MNNGENQRYGSRASVKKSRPHTQHRSWEATPHTNASMIDAPSHKKFTHHCIGHDHRLYTRGQCSTHLWFEVEFLSTMTHYASVRKSVVILWPMLDQNSTYCFSTHMPSFSTLHLSQSRDRWNAFSWTTHIQASVGSPAVRDILNPWPMPAFPRPWYVLRSNVTWHSSWPRLEFVMIHGREKPRPTSDPWSSCSQTSSRVYHDPQSKITRPMVEKISTHELAVEIFSIHHISIQQPSRSFSPIFSTHNLASHPWIHKNVSVSVSLLFI